MSSISNSKSTSLVLHERFNSRILKTILDNWGQISLKNDLNDDIKYTLQKYFNRSLNGIQKVHYYTPSILKVGRKNALGSISLQNIKRTIRQTIAHEYYVDVDMVNAHPVILSYLCSTKNVVCDKLNEYINNREQILKDTGLDRNAAKKRYIQLINMETIPETMKLTEPERLFSNEMQRLQSYFASNYPEDFEKVKNERIRKDDKNENHKAGYMNQLMCQVEDRILMSMYKYFDSPKDCVLCFDGIMLKKGEYDLEGCINQVKTDVGIDIKLEIKPMNEIIDISTFKLSKVEYVKLDTFNDINYFRNQERHITDFERWIKGCVSKVLINGKAYYAVRDNKCTYLVKSKDFAETMNSVTCFIIHPDPETVNLDDPKLNKKLKKVPLTVDGMDGKYKYLTLGFNSKHGAFCNIDNKLDLYLDTDFMPYLSSEKPHINKDIFNLFVPYPFDNFDKTKKRVDTNLFMNSAFYKHYKTNFFREDGEFEHFLDAIADMIRDPMNIKGNAHLMYSPQGTGKGILGTFMRRLMGDANVAIINDSERGLNTNFNTDVSNKILVIWEELKCRGSAQNNANKLKAMITSEMERVEGKGKDAINTRNCARHWFFTNNESAISAEHDDRRYTMHKIKCNNASDNKYFKSIADEVNLDDFIKSALNFFATREYDEENVRTAYDTQYKTREKIDQLSQGIRFLIRYVEDTYSIKRLLDNEHVILKTRDFNEAYKTWCDTEGLRYKASTFKTQLKHLEIDSTKRHRFDDCRCYAVQFKLFDLQSKIQEYLKTRNWLFDIEGNTGSNQNELNKKIFRKKSTKKVIKAKSNK